MLIHPVQRCVPTSGCLRLSHAGWDKAKPGSPWLPVPPQKMAGTGRPRWCWCGSTWCSLLYHPPSNVSLHPVAARVSAGKIMPLPGSLPSRSLGSKYEDLDSTQDIPCVCPTFIRWFVRIT